MRRKEKGTDIRQRQPMIPMRGRLPFVARIVRMLSLCCSGSISSMGNGVVQVLSCLLASRPKNIEQRYIYRITKLLLAVLKSSETRHSVPPIVRAFKTLNISRAMQYLPEQKFESHHIHQHQHHIIGTANSHHFCIPSQRPVSLSSTRSICVKIS